jgi:hypothetical protein
LRAKSALTGAREDSRGRLTSSGNAFAQMRPSLLRCAPALVLFAIVMADAMRSADTDLWSHIYFGRIVLAQHRFLFHAPASYACSPGPSNWPNLEWLGGVVLSFVYDTAGTVGLKLAKFASVAAIMVLIALGEGETGASLEVQATILMGSAVAFMPQMQFRPVLATYLFFAALMTMLARESYGRHVPLWLAVPMLALWANLHGGFFVGLIALGVYTAICGAQDLAHGRGTRRGVRLAALTSAAALATLLNPYGLNDWLMIIPYLRNPFTLRYISEFRPLLAVIADFHREHRPLFTFDCALVVLAATLVAFALTPRADDLALFAIAALMTATALYAVRNTALAVIACCIPLCRHGDLLIDYLRSLHDAGVARPLRIWRVLHASLAVVVVGLAIRTGLLSRTLPAVEAKPVGALAFMRKHNLHGNVLCEYGWAGYLLWHDAPHSKIFIESLFEAYYPHAVQNDYAAVNFDQPGAALVLDAYPNDFVLMPTGSVAYRLLMAQAGWRLIYRDPVSALFARVGSPAAQLAGVPKLVRSAPPSVFP